MERKTQLQLRIELSVKNNKSYPINSYNHLISENDVKSGETYSDIKPSVQARLAQMNYRKDLSEILNNHCINKNGKLKTNLIWHIKFHSLVFRNNRLTRKDIISTIKRNGVLFKLMNKKIIKSSQFPINLDYLSNFNK